MHRQVRVPWAVVLVVSALLVTVELVLGYSLRNVLASWAVPALGSLTCCESA
jgi:hypothetical protein